MFIDNEGNVAVAAAHDWKLDDTTGFKYPEHGDTLPQINPIGKISRDLACNWNTDDTPQILPFLFVL